MCNRRLYHPLTTLGVQIGFLWLAGVPSLRDSTPASALTSLQDSEFRRLRLPDNSRFVEASSAKSQI